MPTSTTSRRRLGALAAACLLSVALPTTAAWAQKSKTKGETAAETAVASEFAVEIPTIEAVDSSVDDDTLRAILSGNVVDNADALAGLTATSITVPEITINASSTIDGETTDVSLTMTDLVLTDVTDGVAASFSMAGFSMDAGEGNGSAEFGNWSASNFNLGGMLGIYGLVDTGGSTELSTIYTDFSFEGGTITSPEAECTIGTMTAAEFKGRPLKYSFADMMAMSQAMEDSGEQASPETMGMALRMYADIFTAFESSPVEFGGFDCSGTDEDGRPIAIAIAGMTMGGMSPGRYPEIAMDGMEISVEDDGTISLGSAVIKSMDLSAPIAAVEAAPEAIDEAWLTANARSLIPAFAGFSFGDLSIDIPNPDAEGERINASIGAFDLTLDAYVNGIPSDILTTASNIMVDLPADSTDPQVQQLIALGVTNVDAGFTIDASWNEAENAIAVDEVSFTGANLATVVLTGTIANATKALFALDENEMLAAAMGIAVANLKVDVTDAGLSDIVLAAVAADQGGTPEQMRPVFAGLAEGTVVGMLAGAADAQKLGAAINSFVSGQAKQLIIELTAKDAPGLGLMDFMAAESDPTVLIGKVNINATAK